MFRRLCTTNNPTTSNNKTRPFLTRLRVVTDSTPERVWVLSDPSLPERPTPGPTSQSGPGTRDNDET